MSGFFSKQAKTLLVVGLLAFVMVAILGMGTDMKTNKNGDMEGCIFLTGTVMLCTMGPFEHSTLWQKTFTTVPPKTRILLVMASLLVVLSFSTGRLVPTPLALQKLHLLRHIALSIFDPIRLAFAQGIIHPKIYEDVVF